MTTPTPDNNSSSSKKQHILVFNLGSSSLKFHLYQINNDNNNNNDENNDDNNSRYYDRATLLSNLALTLSGVVSRIGESKSSIKVRTYSYCHDDTTNNSNNGDVDVDDDGQTSSSTRTTTGVARDESSQWMPRESIESHSVAIGRVLDILRHYHQDIRQSLLFIGHRVVHGGASFHGRNCAYRINDHTIAQIEKVSELAPLHNPVNLRGILECRDKFEGIEQVAVFDTTFHHTLPNVAYTYALPRDTVDNRVVRKYGFHGISHEYVSCEATDYLKRFNHHNGSNGSDGGADNFKIISLHLGNGCSACAIHGGRSIETSMGMTPLQGLVMGTRCGDIDPEFIFYTLRSHDDLVNRDTVYSIEKLLNSKSGLKGICGANDMRCVIDLMNSGDENGKLAFDLFCYRIRQYIGSYFVTLGGCDAIVFTAGIGENSAEVRREVCKQLACIGVELDESLNSNQDHDGRSVRDISAETSRVRVLVVPTDEDKQIAVMGVQLLSSNDASSGDILQGEKM